MGGKKAKCGSCHDFFMFPSSEKLIKAATEPEPVAAFEEFDILLHNALSEPPEIPSRSRFSGFSFKLPRFTARQTGRKTDLLNFLPRPKALRYQAQEWVRYMGGYLPRILLLILAVLGVIYLLFLPADPQCPTFFTWAAAGGVAIICFGFQEDGSTFSNIMSVLVTIFTWATAMTIAVIPSVMLFLMFFVSYTSDVKLSPYECGISLGIITGLFFIAIMLTGAFMKYGFFRPAAIFFLAFCWIAPEVQSFCYNPFRFYATIYSMDEDGFCRRTAESHGDKDPLVKWVVQGILNARVDSVEQVVTQLISEEASVQQQVFAKLARLQPVTEKQEMVCHTIISILKKRPEPTVWRGGAIEALVNWMTPEVSEELVRMIETAIKEEQYWQVNQLARVPDPRIAAAVVWFWQGHSTALQEGMDSLGPRAEKPLLRYLTAEDQAVLVRTSLRLGEIGTKQSIPDLTKLLKNKDPLVVCVAESSIKHIEERGK